MGQKGRSGPKAMFRPKVWFHSMQFTPDGLDLMKVQAESYGVNRSDYVEALLREHADRLVLGEKTGRSQWPGKDPRPRTFRLTKEGHQALRRAVRRLKASEGDIVEGLVRKDPKVRFTGSEVAA